MPSDDVVNHFIDKVGPELLFVIGLLVIFAYVSVKSIPMLKEIKLERIKSDHDLAEQRLSIDKQREARKAEEMQEDIEAERARAEQRAEQNKILESVSRAMENLSMQTTALVTTVTDSKEQSRVMGSTVMDTNKTAQDTNKVVHDTHQLVLDLNEALRK